MKDKFRKFQFEVFPYLAIPFFIGAFILAGLLHRDSQSQVMSFRVYLLEV